MRSKLANAGQTEARVLAIIIAGLRRVNRGTTIHLMTANGGGSCKAVARALASLGFGNVYVVSGGFQAWKGNRLGTTVAPTVSNVQVLAPSVQVLPPERPGTARTIKGTSPRKFLPGGN